MRGVEQIPWLYDAFMAVLEWSEFDRWRRWLVGGARGRTLDVGCGTGRNLPLFQPGTPLLGLGADGHTASLFPGTAALDERLRLAVANAVPARGAVRYTLTFPVFEAARRVVFLVAGAEKAGVVRRILEEGERSGLHAARERSRDGETIWLLDRAVARERPSG